MGRGRAEAVPDSQNFPDGAMEKGWSVQQAGWLFRMEEPLATTAMLEGRHAFLSSPPY